MSTEHMPIVGASVRTDPLNPIGFVVAPGLELVTAYQATDFEVAADPPFMLRVGSLQAPIDAWLEGQHASRAVVITSCNPFSRTLSPSENAARMQGFEDEVGTADLRWLHAIGKDPVGLWPSEPSLCVFDAPPSLIDAWLEQYGQYAAAICTLGEGCRLIWHPKIRDPLGG